MDTRYSHVVGFSGDGKVLTLTTLKCLHHKLDVEAFSGQFIDEKDRPDLLVKLQGMQRDLIGRLKTALILFWLLDDFDHSKPVETQIEQYPSLEIHHIIQRLMSAGLSESIDLSSDDWRPPIA